MKRLFLKISVFLISVTSILTLSQFAPAGHTSPEEFRMRKTRTDPVFLDSPQEWVDSVMNSLSMEDKIAQLFMIAAYSNRDKKHEEELEKTIREYTIGGLIFFQGTPLRQAILTNQYQKRAKTPMLIAMDAESGLSMRLDSTVQYPRQMMLGSIQNEKLIYDMGGQIASQLKRLGVHINFAPVVDINSNPSNPVISSRSFGEDRANVTRKSLLYMLGMQDNGILAVAKHFPGHGDTEVDSHLELPVIKQDRNQLDSVELFPFKELIYSGISGIMTGHLNLPLLDNIEERPASLSGYIVDTLLKKEMDFKGLIFTDAMNMKGITSHYAPDTAVVNAFLAGNDIILMPDEIHDAIKAIKRELDKGTIQQEEIEIRCRKILTAKYWAGLNKYTPIDIKGLNEDLHQPRFELLNRKLIESSLTVAINKNGIIPVQKLDTLSIGSISLGDAPGSEFQQALRLYAQVDTFHFDCRNDQEDDSVYAVAKKYKLLIISIHTDDIRASRNFGICNHIIKTIDSLCENHTVILDLFSSPYVVMRLKNQEKLAGLVLSYENMKEVQQLSAQLIFGAIPGHANLPVTLSDKLPEGIGIYTRNLDRLKYSIPLECKMNPDIQNRIDSIIRDAIFREVMPGCQLLVARGGIVFINKAYGKPTYKSDRYVTTESLYDLASVTKTTATVPTLMKLFEEGKIDPDKPLSKYYRALDGTNKKDITVKSILLHKAGLVSWIPFYLDALEPAFPSQSLFSSNFSPLYSYRISSSQYLNRYTRFKKGYFTFSPDSLYTNQVAQGIYASDALCDTILDAILKSEVDRKPQYKYSDLGFIMLYKTIESITHKSFEEYLNENFYNRLGVSGICFNPLRKYAVEQIMPTEDDQIFRKQIVQGTVHDPAAAMMGGISGHAGLFSNANDMAKVMQMFLNNGSYGGEKYFDPATVDFFTSKPNGEKDNRRGLGFDKPESDPAKASPVCLSASEKSFGHSGFTGTLVWVDPKYQLVYVFLSNRTFPDAGNNKLVEMNIRTKIQQEIYNCLGE